MLGQKGGQILSPSPTPRLDVSSSFLIIELGSIPQACHDAGTFVDGKELESGSQTELQTHKSVFWLGSCGWTFSLEKGAEPVRQEASDSREPKPHILDLSKILDLGTLLFIMLISSSPNPTLLSSISGYHYSREMQQLICRGGR